MKEKLILLILTYLLNISDGQYLNKLPFLKNYRADDEDKKVCTITLDLSDIDFFKLKTSFIRNPNIKELILKRDSISDIKVDAFRDLPNLKILDLSYNKLTSDKLVTWGTVEKLEKLILDYNYQKQVTVTNITITNTVVTKYPLPNLKHLSARKCQISELADTFQSHFSKLEFLDLSENRIHPQKVVSCLPTTINQLHVENAGLTHFCPRRLTNLLSLHLNGNNFEVLGNSGNCEKNTLDLNFNATVQLNQLSLTGCGIKRIEETAFNHCRNLKVLHIENNHFPSIPSRSLESLEVLEELDLSRNDIQVVPNFSVCKNLRKLALNEMVNKKIFEKIEKKNWEIGSLKELSLQGNSLKTVVADIFEKLESLENLDLSRNQIASVNIAWQAKSLKKLVLEQNVITDIGQIMISNASSLETIDISQNTITHFSAKAFQSLPGNVTLNYQPVGCGI